MNYYLWALFLCSKTHLLEDCGVHCDYHSRSNENEEENCCKYMPKVPSINNFCILLNTCIVMDSIADIIIKWINCYMFFFLLDCTENCQSLAWWGNGKFETNMHREILTSSLDLKWMIHQNFNLILLAYDFTRV